MVTNFSNHDDSRLYRFCTLSVHGVDATALAMRGMTMTSEEALELEKKLEQDPDDINARTKLLGYYFQKKYSDKSALAAQEAIVLWLVKNKPRAEVLRGSFARLDAVLNPDAYQEAKKEWLAHLKEHPADLEILEMSAAFFLVQSRELAEQSLLKSSVARAKRSEVAIKIGGAVLAIGIQSIEARKENDGRQVVRAT